MNLWYVRRNNKKKNARVLLNIENTVHGRSIIDCFIWIARVGSRASAPTFALSNDVWQSTTENSFSHLMSGKRYTTVSTNTHTPSTKCQYISPATIAQWFFGVKSPRRERINRTNKKMRPTITCEAWRPVRAKKHEPWSEDDGVKLWSTIAP